MKTSDILDDQVIAACRTFHASPDGPRSIDLLIAATSAPAKVAYRAMERAAQRGLIEYGISLGTAWPTK